MMTRRVLTVVALATLAAGLFGYGGFRALVGPNGPPPPVEVQGGDIKLTLEPWTYCYGGTCSDGFPPETPQSLGSPESVTVDFALSDWTFEATFVEVGSTCPRRITVPLKRSEHGFELGPAGPAGTWDVELFGRGNGDLFTSFRWQTPVDGTMPTPRGMASVISENDDKLDSYGVEFGVSDLAATPLEASADIMVTAASGNKMTIDATAHSDCFSAGGTYFTASEEQGKLAAALGQAPFTYVTNITLDGTTYVGTGVWPEDEIEEQSPAVELTFNPPLPAYTGD